MEKSDLGMQDYTGGICTFCITDTDATDIGPPLSESIVQNFSTHAFIDRHNR